jgi:hypothetical protein
MEDENNIDQCWLVILACACPNCGYPSITYLLPAFEPTEQFIDQTQMHPVKCGRCHVTHLPPVLGCHRQVVPWSLQRYYPPCIEGI